MTVALCLLGVALVGATAGVTGAGVMLARARRGLVPLDVPDARRLHTSPTPRGGGIGLTLAVLLGLPVAVLLGASFERERLLLVVAWAVPNAILGVVDDHRPVSTIVKLAVQLAVAAAAVAAGLRLDVLDLPGRDALSLGPLAGPLCVLWLVWLTNVFNFMDGMDALAAGCGVIFFGGLTALALLVGAPGHAALALSAGAALLGFLRYNLPPARIFMGDGGSLFAGAMLGGLTLALARDEVGGVPLVASALLVGSFTFDATFTVARRAARGLALRPHRTHFYQRLAMAGWSHGRVRALYLGLTLGGLGAALAFIRGTPNLQRIMVVATAAVLASTVVVTRTAERRARRRARDQRT